MSTRSITNAVLLAAVVLALGGCGRSMMKPDPSHMLPNGIQKEDYGETS